MRGPLLLLLVLLLTTLVPAPAQDSPPADPPDAEQAPDPATRSAGEGPVAVPEPSERAWEYYRSGNLLWGVSQLWGILVPGTILFTGLSARMRDLAQRVGKVWFFTLIVYFFLYTLLTSALDLPLDYYRGFARPHAYGLSNLTFAKWASDLLKGLAVGLVVGSLFLWVPYLLLKRSPRRWWLYTSLLAVPFLLFFMLLRPIWIDPLFNDFGPMEDKALEGKILAMAERSGIEGSRVFEVNKSVDTKMINAYVTGFGASKRIVLWDTLLRKLDERQVLVVMAHEMGHYVLDHVTEGIAFGSLLILVTLLLAHRIAGWAMARWKERFGFAELGDPASLPLLLLLTGVIGFLVTPVQLAYSRHKEHEADRFALEMTKDNRAAASAFATMQREALAIPRPGTWFKLWRASHPPLGERIDFCNTYRPWESGQPLVYGNRFRR